ncbi:magnesium chelatase [Dermacoccus sp. PE3]|uniref:VWA domain-containing protein n=1 Tax=Dermacoccus sp. PE3 TaxID=1641401 RepID=UPI000641F651|nr:VWA domain-containing protein [Dermacoccus sp. PE3]KLO61904.1 magnesium chelatase [Dermacoccus sp. PE3]
MSRYPFTAVVGADDLELALVLTTISPAIGGVLVRGEKGTAKSTIVRGLVDVLPRIDVVAGCRYSCDPRTPEPNCPDGPHDADGDATSRPVRLVELPVGAGDDRVSGSLDLARALGAGSAEFRPGLLAEANRGLLYVDEVNLLHDHLVDLLLDASAMGSNTVERDGMSVTHAARFVLVGTMNPEEGELRPQLLDRFGLSVDVAASRDPEVRAEVVTRRLAFDANPDAFLERFAGHQARLRERIAAAQERVGGVVLSPWALRTIARVCAGFDVDGMRADIVIARTASAHAAWRGADAVEREDIRAAAVLALAHRRRRGPFDPPGLDEDLLDRLLDEEPPPPPEGGDDPDDEPQGPDDEEPSDSEATDESEATDGPSADSPQPPPAQDDSPRDEQSPTSSHDTHAETEAEQSPADTQDEPQNAAAPVATASVGAPYRPQRFELSSIGRGEAGRRSRAETTTGRVVGVRPDREGKVHLLATVREAAVRQVARKAEPGSGLLVEPADLRHARIMGRESNLVLFCVDASGSMAARKRMSEVKTAVLSLLLDAYERRDKVGLVTFAGDGARLALPPTSSVDRAATLLADVPHGGRTPVEEGLLEAADVLRIERLRDPNRRPLLVLVTDGRATSGERALERAFDVADRWHSLDVETIVVDCESGRFRLGLAGQLAQRMLARHVPLEQVSATGLIDAIAPAATPRTSNGKAA